MSENNNYKNNIINKILEFVPNEKHSFHTQLLTNEFKDFSELELFVIYENFIENDKYDNLSIALKFQLLNSPFLWILFKSDENFRKDCISYLRNIKDSTIVYV